MTKHLPECPMKTEEAICCTLTCICDALRVCEARVTGELLIANTPPVTDQQWIDDARRGGYEDALADAVALVEFAARYAMPTD